jgi:hypothetical protein
MARPETDVKSLDNVQLENLIENHRAKGATDRTLYIEALAEQAKRTGKGLDFATTMRVIKQAAAEKKYLSYGEIAAASGVDWNKVRYAIGPHLDSLLEYCHRNGLPLLTAIVVNKQNLQSGDLEAESLKGFVAGARKIGIPITDEKSFLRDQQRLVFEWAKAPTFQ